MCSIRKRRTLTNSTPSDCFDDLTSCSSRTPHISRLSQFSQHTRISKFKYLKHPISTCIIQQCLADSCLSISVPLLSPFTPRCTCRASSNPFTFKRSRTSKECSRSLQDEEV